MRNTIKALAVMVAGMIGTSACAETFSTQNTLIIKGPIAGPSMAPIAAKMDELLAAPAAPARVNLLIDSPGGSVYSGFRFIAQMKSLQGKGTKFSCYVPGLAASMAFHILTHCDERVVLEESALLWHRARVFIMFGVITAPAASAVSRDLEQIDNHILADVHESLASDMKDEDISYHFEHETLHIGQKLCSLAPHFCTAKSHVPGLMEAMQSKKVTITRQTDEEDVLNMFTGVESVVYVYQRYLQDMIEGE